jgi:putative selenium metabolism protein SsnA
MVRLIGNGRLFTRNSDKPYIKDGCVAVQDENIVDFGKTAELKTQYPQADFYDACGKVIMPGFINTHQHIYSALARGMSLKNSKPSKNFDEILENLWWRVDRALNFEEIKYSAYATYLDSVKNGVTTVFDHHASYGNIAGSLFEITDVAKKLGVRTNLAYEVSDRDGKEKCDAAIKENLDFAAYAKKQGSDMLGAMFGLHASFTLSTKTLEKCADLAGDIGFHVHVAEGKGDLKNSLDNYNMRVVERLNSLNILGEKSIAVHCIHIDENEMDILKDTNTAVVHNPQSNMGNAVGASNVLKIFEKGVLLGMGTDGYTTDMIESLKTTNIIHKHVACDPSVCWGEPPTMLFENNRKIVQRYISGNVGIIKKDALADIIVVDYDPLTPMDENNLDSHIHFGMMGKNTVSTMINGKMVMKDRVILPVDEREIYAKSREVAAKFWQRA